VILVIAVLFVGVGFWQGWFSATSNAGGKTGFSVTFNKDKLKGDWSKMTDKVKTVAKGAAAKVKGLIKKDDAGMSSLEGKVVSVDAVNNTITVEADGKQVELPMLATESIQSLDELVGKTVKLDLEEKDEAVVIRNIVAK
ncbi:MAG TPA: hypothetical protein PKE00_14445, partial [Planctomycetota bacterium]|nr:hypothetical protein [Planctomycetota bacterium]